MSDNKNNNHSRPERPRPEFPKRAVITGGMPYGNKDLHFGHIGGYFTHADIFARFLRDRIGKENVIFVSGTDCYGSPIVAHYEKMCTEGQFSGTIEEFVRSNHEKQQKGLKDYHISLDLFAASSFGRASEIHKETCKEFFTKLHEHGHLEKLTSSQFYDPEKKVFLNGRQVLGRCPIDGCGSEKGYADECSLGHQYMPKDLIEPKSALSGKEPEMKDVTNWYLKLYNFRDNLQEWTEQAEKIPGARPFMIKAIREFLEPPVIYVKRDQDDLLEQVEKIIPTHERENAKSKAIILTFKTLEDREKACPILTEKQIRYRTGKTLVPFRLTGNVEWGLEAPVLEDMPPSTFWVWPESLWAPISFTKTLLEEKKENADAWKKWWCCKEAKVYQFIGEDNVYFYGPAEMAMFMGDQDGKPVSDIKENDLQLPELIANNHILFLDKKASSSGKVKPPMADELLEHYSPEQLRAHFFSLGLGKASVSFQPKPLNPAADPNAGDPVLKEGNLLCNTFNRAVRSCFYTIQKYNDNKIPVGEISEEVLENSKRTILDYESRMHRHDFHLAMAAADNYIRKINKYWAKSFDVAEKENNSTLRDQTVIDAFHMVKIATVLMHPITPIGTEMIREYLGLGEEIWDWEKIFDTIYTFMDNPKNHHPKFLEPRVDFFPKPEAQFNKDIQIGS